MLRLVRCFNGNPTTYWLFSESLVNHTRIQTRDEADGLRAAWAQTLDQLKASCES